VVAFDDADRANFPDLARSEGVPGVSSEDPASWRGLHGRLFEKLALGAPAVVATDVTFRNPRPADDERLVAGVRALVASGTRVVAGFRDFDASGTPLVTAQLREVSSLEGLMFLGEWTDAGVCFGSLLVANHSRGQSPSLGLAAYAVDRGGQHSPSFQWSRNSNYVTIEFHGAPSTSGVAPSKPEAERIFLLDGSGESTSSLSRDMNIDVADASYDAFALERRPVLAERTVRYGDVFAMDERALRQRFGGVIVVLGDTCESHKDMRPFVDLDGSRVEFSCFGHAGEIDKLLRGERTRRPGFTLHFLTLAGAAAATAAAMALWRPPSFVLRSGVVLLALGAALVGGAWVGATVFHVVLSPSQYAVVALVEVVGSAAIRRTSDRE